MNKLIISNLNPIKFVTEGYELPEIYNVHDHDEFRYQDTVPDFYEQRNYFQPWQSSDIIYLQFLANYGPINIHVYKCNGDQVDSFAADYIPTSIEGAGLKVYEVAIALNSYPVGNYYLKLEAGDPILDTQVSEVFEIAERWPHSVLFEYTHNENDYDVVFETGVVFRFRSHGGLRNFQPASDRTVYIDQVRNITQLSGKYFSTKELVIGGYEGVPDWMIERICNVFTCSKVYIDGKQYMMNDGATLEPVREDYYPMTGWRLEVRPNAAKTSRVSDLDGNPNSELTVVYQIDSVAFGGKSTPAGTNIIQITSNGYN